MKLTPTSIHKRWAGFTPGLFLILALLTSVQVHQTVKDQKKKKIERQEERVRKEGRDASTGAASGGGDDQEVRSRKSKRN